MKAKGYARGERDRRDGRVFLFGTTIYSGKYLTNWQRGWRAEDRKQKAAATKTPRMTWHQVHGGHPLDRKAIEAAVKRAGAKLSHFNAAKVYVIFSKKDRKLLLGWGIHGTLASARKKLHDVAKNAPVAHTLDRKAYGICKAVIVSGNGRTW